MKFIVSRSRKLQIQLHWIITTIILVILLFILETVFRFILTIYEFRFIDLPYISLINYGLEINIGYILILFNLIIIIGFFLWGGLGKILSKKLIIENYVKKSSNMGLKFIVWIFGLNFKGDYEYFIEESVKNIDLSIKQYPILFKERINEVVSISFGTVFIIILFVISFYDLKVKENAIIIFNLMFSLLLISPLFISLVLPISWIVKDSNIKFLDNEKNIKNLIEKVDKSTLKRIIKFTGFFTAISFFIDYNSTMGLPFIENLIFTLYAIIIIFMLITITSFAIGLNYLSIFHQKYVNEVRRELENNGMPLANTNYIKSEDQKVKKFREEMSESKPSEIKKKIKIIVCGFCILFIIFYISLFLIQYSEAFFIIIIIFFGSYLIIIIFLMMRIIKKAK